MWVTAGLWLASLQQQGVAESTAHVPWVGQWGGEGCEQQSRRKKQGDDRR